MSTTHSQPDAYLVVIEQRDRFDIAELLLAEVVRLQADARTKRRNSPVREKLFSQAARLHELSVRIRP